MTLLATARRAGFAALNLLLPPQCLTCDAPVDVQGAFCGGCFRQTNFISAPHCIRCGVPFAYLAEGGPDMTCPGCLKSPPPWGTARAALAYDDQAKKLLLPFKHADRIEHAGPLAAMMARSGAALLARADILVPVPLHRARLRTRRYNQAGLLARALGRRAGLRWLPDALIRAKPTPPLGELDALARAAVVDGVFAVRPQHLTNISGARVLLIDDVMTSGATCRGCTQVLLEAGAEAVNVLVAARVPDPRLR